MELTIIEFLSGLFSLILIILSLYIGLYIASRYRKFNNRNLLFIGFAWCGVFNGWYPPAISFVLILLTGQPLHPQLYYLIFDYNAIGEFKGPFDVEYKGIVSIWTLFVMITLLITGLLLSRESLRSEDPENKLRGYFLAYAFIVYIIKYKKNK
ncbi:MAG: hypothetical protein EU529_12020 [Promethearchaeota archaeon]|nr:MAG: hypothetical protein EU529_12020 [Candidatus Lokiarchaeota archaeon]